jgi:hypothetical protein
MRSGDVAALIFIPLFLAALFVLVVYPSWRDRNDPDRFAYDETGLRLLPPEPAPVRVRLQGSSCNRPDTPRTLVERTSGAGSFGRESAMLKGHEWT